MLDGVQLDADVPGVTMLLVQLVADLAKASERVADLALPRMFFFAEPDRLWPTPHSPIFDFEATRHGAEWIDEVASRAREVVAKGVGQYVVGHHDVRVEHVRFDANPPTGVVALFDVDSLCRERETLLVGIAAMMFTADWHRGGKQAPTLEQMQEFVTSYEAARGVAFSDAERAEVDAASRYAIAYVVRCGHALGTNSDDSGYVALLQAVGGPRASS
jgi:hypothetical protein